MLIELTIELAVKLSPATMKLVTYADTAICIVFLYELYLRYTKARDKLAFFKSPWTWIDFISSIPVLALLQVTQIFRIIRILRVFKVFRALREIKALRPAIGYFIKNKSKQVLLIYILLLVFVMFYGSLGLYNAEVNINENINSFQDALWWSFISLTSVGYGDIYPVTGVGRLIAVLLITAGMGLFSIITAEIASSFIVNKNKDQ